MSPPPRRDRWRRPCALCTTHRRGCHAQSTCCRDPPDRPATSHSRGRWQTGWPSGSSAARARPGERLTEPRLAELAGVSRSPVREALRILASEGLVEITPRHGAQVARVGARDARELYRMPTAAGTALRLSGGAGDHAGRCRRAGRDPRGDGGGRGRRAALPRRERRVLPLARAALPERAAARVRGAHLEQVAALLEHLRARRRLQRRVAYRALSPARGGACRGPGRRGGRRRSDPGARAQRVALDVRARHELHRRRRRSDRRDGGRAAAAGGP